MTDIPRTPLLLGLAGLVPLLWGALSATMPGLFDIGIETVGPRFMGIYLLNFYGTVLLAFMSGILWGFAGRADGPVAGPAYGLSVLPAIWAFLMVGGGPESSIVALIAGYLGLLLLDFFFWKLGLAPGWWLRLRLPLTAIATGCFALPLLL
ncbi:DUF3429 domain-containing protein [Rhodovulum sulfidophilum]|uniref:DUF3429 domain-containing protein n=4 Tax=Rhodovulum sulfidophilum TaxID=35806 RepID=A0A0D6B8A9_RHOSU|nr:DUF3429 domain-containing protein [Rhodovulum sulfidophilum]MBL3584302.1 DUF3429 domain-containing protein [Rhodovulum sulfidophilum]MBL3607428.1 DUF3429 domain-containing protein [Rhodovulum sulfidophilum]NDK34640.1 DUF3429 domain-containing protein [Rhodovulum sulfidophilum]OLS53475.1 DUF3429 domain-containing protein [Rhodovulum sulfidophilum]BAQ70979.1 hypothetical protein NHU_03855 [Rhodovulum sulfidophilum]